MTRLREFHCKNWICSSVQKLIALIGRCPILQHLAVDVSHNMLQQSTVLANTLAQLTSLTALEFRSFYDGVIPDLTEGDIFLASTYISHLLNHLGSQETSHIRTLSFGADREPLLLSNSMINAAASISSVLNMQLYNDYFYDEYLEYAILDDNEGIRHDVNGHTPQITSQGMTNFLSMLQRNTQIEIIHFKDIKNSSTEAYKVLGRMCTLRELYISDCSTISKTKI